MRRYAENTAVPISRSRAEIDKLLRAWGATGIQWTDEFEHDRVTLRFIWPRGETRFTARFDLRLPTAKSFEGEATDRRNGRLLPQKLQKLLDARGKHEHRVLALWIKAALNAVDSGIVEPEVLFLPFIENKAGKTVAEATLPALTKGGSVSFPALLAAP